jgi:DNA-binding MarR family transcriptional regulator
MILAVCREMHRTGISITMSSVRERIRLDMAVVSKTLTALHEEGVLRRRSGRGPIIYTLIQAGERLAAGRIASPEMLPKARVLPHLKCSPGEGLGDDYEEGEHGDTPGIGAGDH